MNSFASDHSPQCPFHARKQRLTSAGAKAAEAKAVEWQVVRRSSLGVGTPVQLWKPAVAVAREVASVDVY